MILSAAGGYAAGKYQGFPLSLVKTPSQIVQPKEKVANPDTVKVVESSTLFKNQVATVMGQAIKVDNNTVTIKDRDNKQSSFPLDANFSVFKFDPNNKPTTFKDPKAIDLNKEASFVLEFKDTQYKITSVTFLPNLGAIASPPTASTPATPKK